MTIPIKEEIFNKINEIKAEIEKLEEQKKEHLEFVKKANFEIPKLKVEMQKQWTLWRKFYKNKEE